MKYFFWYLSIASIRLSQIFKQKSWNSEESLKIVSQYGVVRICDRTWICKDDSGRLAVPVSDLLVRQLFILKSVTCWFLSEIYVLISLISSVSLTPFDFKYWLINLSNWLYFLVRGKFTFILYFGCVITFIFFLSN